MFTPKITKMWSDFKEIVVDFLQKRCILKITK